MIQSTLDGNPYFAEKKFPKVNFTGNKRKVVDWIFENMPGDGKTFFDAFSGGCSVSYEAKKRGHKVITNDVLKINQLIAKSFIENKNVRLSEDDCDIIFSGKPVEGFMFKNYSNVLFYPDECMQLDQCRRNVEKLRGPTKKAMALVLLRRAMIRKMPYSRFNIRWSKVDQLRDEEFSYAHYGRKRAYHNDTIEEHFRGNLKNYNDAVFDNGEDNKSYSSDVFALLPKIKADIIYLDPPYPGTMNDYHSFYGVLDEYIKSRKISPFGNNFTSKKPTLTLFEKMFACLKNFKHCLLSYNNNSYPSKEVMLAMMEKHAKSVRVVERKMNYQITGKREKNTNREYLFIMEN